MSYLWPISVRLLQGRFWKSKIKWKKSNWRFPAIKRSPKFIPFEVYTCLRTAPSLVIKNCIFLSNLPNNTKSTKMITNSMIFITELVNTRPGWESSGSLMRKYPKFSTICLESWSSWSVIWFSFCSQWFCSSLVWLLYSFLPFMCQLCQNKSESKLCRTQMWSSKRQMWWPALKLFTL